MPIYIKHSLIKQLDRAFKQKLEIDLQICYFHFVNVNWKCLKRIFFKCRIMNEHLSVDHNLATAECSRYKSEFFFHS